MNKRGQLTLFIIIGIILLFSTAIIIYLQQQVAVAGFQAQPISSIPTEMQPVAVFVNKCLSDAATQGIFYMGTQGGYINPPLNSLLTQNSVIPYYYSGGTNEMPTITTLENEIGSYIEGALPACTNGFASFPNKIQEGAIRGSAKINGDSILVKAFYPLTMVVNGRQDKIDTFVVTVPIRLGHVYDVAKDVVDTQAKSPDIMNLAYLTSFDVNIDVLPYDGTSTVFSITDSKSKIQNNAFMFFFANNIAPNSAPKLDFIPDFVLKTGKQFNYTVHAADADGDAVKYSTSTQLFTINSVTGFISFTPQAEGIVDAVISASDGKSQDNATVRFDIR